MADEHRTRLRGLRTGRHIDPSRSDDPRIRRVLDELAVASRSYATITAPATFRDELRTQLVAITPRITAEAAAAADPAPAAQHPAPRRRRRSIRLARPLAVVGSLVVVLAVVLGGAVWFSRDTVPGDTLYGLKRTSERVQLAFAGNDTDRAHDYLDFATTRVNEARTLVRRASASASGQGTLADGLSPQTQRRIADVLGAADENTRDATRLLGRTAVDDGTVTPLDVITSWGPQQRARLAALSEAIPAGSTAGKAATTSTKLLDAARTRASWVRQNLGCNCLRTHASDSLGPAPGAATTGTTGGTSTSPAPKRSSAPGRTSQPGTGPASTSPRGGGASRSANPSTTPAPSRSRTSQPLVPLPTLPTLPKSTRTPKLNLCHIDLLGLRLCPSPSSS